MPHHHFAPSQQPLHLSGPLELELCSTVFGRPSDNFFGYVGELVVKCYTAKRLHEHNKKGGTVLHIQEIHWSLIVEKEGDPRLLGVLTALVGGRGLAGPRPQQLSGGVAVGVGVVRKGGAVRRGDVAEIQIVALRVEEARLHDSYYELYEVPGETDTAFIRRSSRGKKVVILFNLN